MQDQLFDRDFQLARAELGASLSRLRRRATFALQALGRAHQRVFWSAPWSAAPLRGPKRSLPL